MPIFAALAKHNPFLDLCILANDGFRCAVGQQQVSLRGGLGNGGRVGADKGDSSLGFALPVENGCCRRDEAGDEPALNRRKTARAGAFCQFGHAGF